MRWWLVLTGLVVACGDERPSFQSVLVPNDTTDTVGPYRVEAYVLAPRGVGYVVLRFPSDDPDARPAELLMTRRGEASADDAELWLVDLPGMPVGTTYRFFLVAVDEARQKVSYPSDAPATTISFDVLFAQP